jgi:hypothetical protein
MRTGLGNVSLSMPKLATSVPSVVSVTETPRIRPKVKILFYQDVAELRLRSDFGVEMHRLRVVRERREQKVVGLGNRARDLVTDHFAGHEPLEAFSRH